MSNDRKPIAPPFPPAYSEETMAPITIPPGEDVLWMHVARELIGTKEIAGPKHNPLVLEFFRSTSLKASADEVPWCAAFVGHVLLAAGVKPTGKANARSYLTWGAELKRPVFGCVVVFSRGDNAAQGHVAFFVRSKPGTVERLVVLGGNQANSVCEASYAADRVLSYRWPEGVPLPTGAELRAKA